MSLGPAHPLAVIVAITGASGALYGIKAIDLLVARGDVQVHVVVSPAAWLTLEAECGLSKEGFREKLLGCSGHLDSSNPIVLHTPKAVGACIASGSYPVCGMLVTPCSMRTLAAVAHGFSDNLITRAADVCLKERRPLVLMPRETPLNLAHLRNMQSVTEMGGIIMPPVPAFYQNPQSIDELIAHTAMHVVELLGLPPKPDNKQSCAQQVSQERPVWKGL
jgi:4-hydroxy-3-polyprenylbenzoate decarboxylase